MTKVNAYEALFIIDMSEGEAGVKPLVEKFRTLISENAEITGINEWGKRILAYPINDKKEGYYVLVNLSSKPDFLLHAVRKNIRQKVIAGKEYLFMPTRLGCSAAFRAGGGGL